MVQLQFPGDLEGGAKSANSIFSSIFSPFSSGLVETLPVRVKGRREMKNLMQQVAELQSLDQL